MIPFITRADPKVVGEGALDPLGLSPIAERLADQILPGLRARMSRPRFVTAMAVSAHVCAGLEDELAADDLTPAYLVFEWLLVEAFARRGDRELTRGTPGTMKAKEVVSSGAAMCARTYLRTPTVFGYHGVYKPLARDIRVVDDFRLGDSGYDLLKTWQDEQNLAGFLESSRGGGDGSRLRAMLQHAVRDGMQKAHTDRSPQWAGWSALAEHLPPGGIGASEARLIHQLIADRQHALRAEVFELVRRAPRDATEAEVVRVSMRPNASEELGHALDSIIAFEDVATALEGAFDWIRHLSTTSPTCVVAPTEFAALSETRRLAAELPRLIENCAETLALGSSTTANLFTELSSSIADVRAPEDLFQAVLARHSSVQSAKPPEGKRDWFERTASGAAAVRVPYQRREPVKPVSWWNRPYRIEAARSFLDDVGLAA
jgi:hypothetical protein